MPTQTRISENAHRKLSRIAAETGQTHQQVIEIALGRYERELFLDRMNEGFARLRADAAAWRDEQDERGDWENTLSDGLDA